MRQFLSVGRVLNTVLRYQRGVTIVILTLLLVLVMTSRESFAPVPTSFHGSPVVYSAADLNARFGTLQQQIIAQHKVDGMKLPSINSLQLSATQKKFPLVPSVPRNYEPPPVPLKGQVTLETTFGAKLHELASRPEVNLVLEIGTWYGGGSSWCLATGLRESVTDREHPNKWMFTLEMYGPAFQYASSTLEALPVTCIRAGTVGKAGYLKPEEIPEEYKTTEWSLKSFIFGRERTHYELYYQRDLDLADTEPPLLEPLCKHYDFDLVLLDGNEYTGWAEFLIVRDVCKPRFIALHDCGTLKTQKVEAYLDSEGAQSFKKIAAGTDQAKWAVYESL